MTFEVFLTIFLYFKPNIIWNTSKNKIFYFCRLLKTFLDTICFFRRRISLVHFAPKHDSRRFCELVLHLHSISVQLSICFWRVWRIVDVCFELKKVLFYVRASIYTHLYRSDSLETKTVAPL